MPFRSSIGDRKGVDVSSSDRRGSGILGSGHGDDAGTTRLGSVVSTVSNRGHERHRHRDYARGYAVGGQAAGRCFRAPVCLRHDSTPPPALGNHESADGHAASPLTLPTTATPVSTASCTAG
jgi:hypothetical protein